MSSLRKLIVQRRLQPSMSQQACKNHGLDPPFSVEEYATSECPKPTPRFRSTVESVRSRCHREIGNLLERCEKSAFAMPKFPSEFSKSIGLTCTQHLKFAGKEPKWPESTFNDSQQLHVQIKTQVPSCRPFAKLQ